MATQWGSDGITEQIRGIVMGERARVFLALSEEHGWKQREIAALFGMTQGNVANTMRRYRGKIDRVDYQENGVVGNGDGVDAIENGESC